jgi:hypothetical protein
MTWSRVSLLRDAIAGASDNFKSRAACKAEALSACSLTIERSKRAGPGAPDHRAWITCHWSEVTAG